MKLTDHELKKLQEKALDFRQDPVRRMNNVQRMAKLFLRRHGYNPTNFRINVDTGEITENERT